MMSVICISYQCQCVILKNLTKATNQRDSATTGRDKEWQNFVSCFEHENEVEVAVDFAHKYIVKKTDVYLVNDGHRLSM